MDTSRARTTIRFGASHNGLVTTLAGKELPITLKRANHQEKSEVATLVCELHGIKGATYVPRRKARRGKQTGVN